MPIAGNRVARNGAHPMRVLVIDDDQAVCEVFGEFLQEIGHDPVITHNAETALDALRAEKPDAVLLDVCLPGMSGLDFLKHAAVRDLRVPVLVVSGRATERQAQGGLRPGACDLIGNAAAPGRQRAAVANFARTPEAQTRTPALPIGRRRPPGVPVTHPERVRKQNGPEWEQTSTNLTTPHTTGNKTETRHSGGAT